MFKKIYTLTGAIATAFYPGFAFSTCEYQSKTNLTYQKEIQSIKINGAVAQFGRASHLHCEGCRIIPCQLHIKLVINIFIIGEYMDIVIGLGSFAFVLTLTFILYWDDIK